MISLRKVKSKVQILAIIYIRYSLKNWWWKNGHSLDSWNIRHCT